MNHEPKDNFPQPILPQIPEKADNLLGIQKIYEKLIKRFGDYNTSDWKPSAENIHILNDEDFNKKVTEIIGEEFTKVTVGFPLFENEDLFVRASEGTGQSFEQTIAHEMLHLWFHRSTLDEGNAASYGVNETLVDTLALEATGMYSVPRESREPAIDGAINNSIVIKEIIQKLGEEGWENIFEACQTGDQTNIAALMEKTFGKYPPEELQEINKALPVVFGTSFGRD